MLKQVLNGLMAGVLVLAVTAPVSAQGGARTGATLQPQAAASGFQFNGRFAGWQPNGAVGAGMGNSAGPAMPSNVSVVYPNAPWQQPGILQNMLQMRATSLRPNEYMGGAYNPVYQSNSYPINAYRPVYYRGYSDPYGLPTGYSYGGVSGYGYPATAYVPTTAYVYAGTGAWGPVFAPPGPVIIQR